jgi:hypothetical protein
MFCGLYRLTRDRLGTRLRIFGLLIVFCVALVGATESWAGTDGSLSGTVRDSSKAVLRNAAVTAINVDTRLEEHASSNDSGFYAFTYLPVGRYDVRIESTGFKTYRRTGIVVDINARITVDAVLDVGNRDEAVTVNGTVVRLDTSDTQMGQVISGKTSPELHPPAP